MDVIIGPALALIFHLIELYTWVIIIGVIMSWLIHFNVINLSNQFVRMVYDVVNRLTEPVLRKIRGFLPDLGGVDISPVILILLLWFAKDVIARLAMKLGRSGDAVLYCCRWPQGSASPEPGRIA